MVMHGNYCGDHFATYTNIKSLCCKPETNITFCVNYISIKKNKNKIKYVALYMEK